MVKPLDLRPASNVLSEARSLECLPGASTPPPAAGIVGCNARLPEAARSLVHQFGSGDWTVPKTVPGPFVTIGTEGNCRGWKAASLSRFEPDGPQWF